MLSIFKKAAPEPPAKVEPKGTTYDLDVGADGDDPVTAANVVDALYAKYKKNVRVADGPPRARRSSPNAMSHAKSNSRLAT